MGQREHLESALRDGLMLTDHEVQFAPIGDGEAASSLLNQILPLLESRLESLGQPLESLSEERQRVIFLGIGNIKGKVPMLCLTEVPSGRVIDMHRLLFGSYGLVISRDWVERNGGDKVIYIGHNSTVTHQLFINLATLRIFGLFVDRNGQVLFDNESIRPVLNLLSFFQMRDHLEEAEWRITGNHGFMGGERESGKRLPLTLEEIEYVFAPDDREAKELSILVEELKQKQGAKIVPKIISFPNQIPL